MQLFLLAKESRSTVLLLNEGKKFLILTHGNSPQDTRDEAGDDDLRIDDGLVALCYGIDEEVGRTGQQYATVNTK